MSDRKPFTTADFRKELLAIMPGYKWTVHKTKPGQKLEATGIQSSGFNRLSTLSVTREQRDGYAWYAVKSAGHGTRAFWMGGLSDRTLARALRGLQEYYQGLEATYRSLAASLQAGRTTPKETNS